MGGDCHSRQNLDAAVPTTYGNLVSPRVQRIGHPELTVGCQILDSPLAMKKKSRHVARAKGLVHDATESKGKSVVRSQRRIRRLRGSVPWEGDLQESRIGRTVK